jgi:microtubule-associated protein-like 1/2
LHSLIWKKSDASIIFQGLYETVSLCFHPFGVVLAAGSTEGHLVVLNAENGAPVVTIRVCGSPLNCLGYNPGNFVTDTIMLVFFFTLSCYNI